MRWLAVAAACLALAGCALPAWMISAGAAGTAVYGYVKLVNSDASTVLSADAPIKADLCKLYDPAKHDAVRNAEVETYCANIPTTPLKAVETVVKVVKAAKTAKAKAQPPAAKPPVVTQAAAPVQQTTAAASVFTAAPQPPTQAAVANTVSAGIGNMLAIFGALGVAGAGLYAAWKRWRG